MNVIRQETDYALRLMAVLAATDDGEPKSVSTRVLAEQGDVSYEFACKILQKQFGDVFPLPEQDEVKQSSTPPVVTTGTSA